jgi:hypothetical protein
MSTIKRPDLSRSSCKGYEISAIEPAYPATLLSSHPVILTMRAADFADILMLIARLRAPPAPV